MLLPLPRQPYSLPVQTRRERASGSPPDGFVLVGRIAGAHGVRGSVRIKSYTAEPESIARYGALRDAEGRSFQITLIGAARGELLANIEGVRDRNVAEELRGTKLYAARGAFPEIEEDEFYASDLVGLEARRPNGVPIGTVVALADFGAGPLVEIALEHGGTTFVPFTRAVVPVIDIAAGTMIVEAPEAFLDAEAEASDG
jgi:16S rRNA processing protein RimM